MPNEPPHPDPHLEDLRAQARYAHNRRDLYRAKVHGPRPVIPGRLQELERAAQIADDRLKRAEDARRV